MNFSVLILYLYTDYNIIQGILFEKNCIAYFTKKLILYYYYDRNTLIHIRGKRHSIYLLNLMNQYLR